MCDLLPGPAFVSIVSQLVQSRNSVIRKKSMDLFNKRMSKNTRPCSAEEVKIETIDNWGKDILSIGSSSIYVQSVIQYSEQ